MECDYSKLPSREIRRNIIAAYLFEYSAILKGMMFPQFPDHDPYYCPNMFETDAVERLVREVDSYRGFPGLYWQVPLSLA